MSIGRRAIGLAVAVAAATSLVVQAGGAGAGIRTGDNYRLRAGNQPARGKDAVGLAVNPRNRDHIVEVNTNLLDYECEFNVSFDGGRTWRGGQFQAPEGFDSGPCSPVGHGSSAMDAGVAFTTGNDVVATFASALPGAGQSILVARSTDGGRSFSTAAVAMPGGPNPTDGPEYRFPKLAVDPSDRGTVYLVAAENSTRGVSVAVSTDGGETWSPPVDAAGATEEAIEPSQPAVDGDGDVYVAYRTRGTDALLRVARSVDGGATWSQFDVAPVQAYQTFTGSSFPRLAADPDNNNLYVVYGQGPFSSTAARRHARSADHFIHPDMDVLFTRSTDGGSTWSESVKVNDPSATGDLTQTRHPNVSVAPNGRVDVVWNDRRHTYKMQQCSNTHSPPAGTAPCTEARMGDTYYASSNDGGVTWSRNRRLTDRTINLDVGFDYRFGTYWDFGPVAVPIGNRRILVGWMDSREGNFDNDIQDIYLARVNLDADGSAPVREVHGGSTPALTIQMSRLANPGGSEATLASTFATKAWTRVVIVNRADRTRALAAGVLARFNLGPVLASGANGLPARVRAEVARMGAIGAYVVGGRRLLSDAVIDDLEAAGVPLESIVRIGGSAAEAAAEIAARVDTRSEDAKLLGTPAFDGAIIVNPSGPQGSAAAALAAYRRLPVLFVSRNSVPDATASAIDSLALGETLIVGPKSGRGGVSADVAAELPTPARLGGRGLAAVSRKVVAKARELGAPENIVYVVAGARTAAFTGAAIARLGGLQVVAADASPAGARALVADLGLRRLVDKIVLIHD